MILFLDEYHMSISIDRKAEETRMRYVRRRKWFRYLIPIGLLPILILSVGILAGGISGTQVIIGSLDQALFAPIIIEGIFLVSEKEDMKSAPFPSNGKKNIPEMLKMPFLAAIILIPLILQLSIKLYPDTDLLLMTMVISLVSIAILSYFTLQAYLYLR